MPQVYFSRRALDDLDRLFEFLAQHDTRAAKQSGEQIIDATATLQRHPLIGRQVRGPLGEVVISRGRTGYVALYRYLPGKDQVEVLAIRHRREAGHR